ncbi:sensor histidine kinase [Streptomyces sp. NPDC001193]
MTLSEAAAGAAPPADPASPAPPAGPSATADGGIDRLNAFDGLFLRAEHLNRIQDYARELALAVGAAGGPGVVEGYEVGVQDGTLRVGGGLAVSAQGRPLRSQRLVTLPLTGLEPGLDGFWWVEVAPDSRPYGDAPVQGSYCDDPCSGTGTTRRPYLAEGVRIRLAEHGLALAADALARTTDPAALRRQAAFLSGAARAAAAESRALLTDLRREAQAPGVSLSDELRRLATAADAEFRTRGVLPPFPCAVAHHVLSITSEALENARRHAGASCVRVEAEAGADALTLTVEDDGCGLPPDARHRGDRFGLLGMTERAAAIGARLHIGPGRSGPGRSGPGTVVRLDLPLTAPTPEGGP